MNDPRSSTSHAGPRPAAESAPAQPSQAEPTVAELSEWDRTHVWHAFTQMAEYEPFLIERAAGCVLYGVDGQEYLDGVSSLWCNLHGHRHPAIDASVRAQLDQAAHITLLGMAHPTTVKLARRLAELAPGGLPHVFFSDSGASAVEVALKLAFQFWRQTEPPQPERRKFLAWENAYHGDTLGAVSVGGVPRFQQMFAPLLFETVRLPAPDTYRLPPGVSPAGACDFYLSQFAAALRQHGPQLAAVVIEPLLQCAAGLVRHPPGFLRGVAELCRQHDVLLIADEVAVGLGRTGRLFACEHEGVTPDLLCLAKGLTGGYLPLAATLASDRIWQAFLGTYAQSRTFFHGHTYGGNPLGAAAALATLNIFEQERTLEQLPEKVARLAENLAPLRAHPQVGDVRQLGLIAGVELVRDRAAKEPFPWAEQRGIQVCRAATRRGVWLRPLGNVIVVMPPLAISLAQLDQLGAALRAAVAEVLGAAA